MLPALPTGMQSASSSPSSSSDLEGGRLLALEAERVDAVDERDRVALGSSRTSSSAWSKLPRSAIDARAVHERLGELAAAILPSGTITAPRSPRARGVGRQRLAAVLPVEAQMHRLGPLAHGAETAQVIPRSLNEPVGFGALDLQPHLGADALGRARGAGTSGVEPSCSDDDGIARARTAAARGSAR